MNQGPGPRHRGPDAQRMQWSARGGSNGLCCDGTGLAALGRPAPFCIPRCAWRARHEGFLCISMLGVQRRAQLGCSMRQRELLSELMAPALSRRSSLNRDTRGGEKAGSPRLRQFHTEGCNRRIGSYGFPSGQTSSLAPDGDRRRTGTPDHSRHPRTFCIQRLEDNPGNACVAVWSVLWLPGALDIHWLVPE